jgi:protein-disulfide isomerase/uncharacterized membrane protein
VANNSENSFKGPYKSSASGPLNKTGQTGNRTFFWAAVVVGVLSILDHGFLLFEHYTLRFGQASSQSLCNINELFNCAAVSASRYSEFLGVPMALWGISGNLVLLLLILWYPLTEPEKKPSSRFNILLVSGLIATTSVIMGFVSTALIGRLCPFCIGAYILSFALFFCLWKGLEKPASSLLGASYTRNFTTLFILSGVAFFVSFIAHDQIKASFGARDLTSLVQEAVSSWSINPKVAIQTVEPLTMGASAEMAKMTIVEFADYRCIHCKHAAPVIKAFIESHPDSRLEFQTWPLDGECNSAIPTRNGASCLLARAVYCAQKTGGNGWHAHEWVFDHFERMTNVDAIKALLPEIAGVAGAPIEQLISCTDSAETKSAIEKGAAVGTSLNISGTPTIYVNGKKLPSGQSLQVLSSVYDTL